MPLNSTTSNSRFRDAILAVSAATAATFGQVLRDDDQGNGASDTTTISNYTESNGSTVNTVGLTIGGVIVIAAVVLVVYCICKYVHDMHGEYDQSANNFRRGGDSNDQGARVNIGYGCNTNYVLPVASLSRDRSIDLQRNSNGGDETNRDSVVSYESPSAPSPEVDNLSHVAESNSSGSSSSSLADEELERESSGGTSFEASGRESSRCVLSSEDNSAHSKFDRIENPHSVNR